MFKDECEIKMDFILLESLWNFIFIFLKCIKFLFVGLWYMYVVVGCCWNVEGKIK